MGVNIEPDSSGFAESGTAKLRTLQVAKPYPVPAEAEVPFQLSIPD